MPENLNPYSLSIVTEQYKSFKILQLPLLSRELGLMTFRTWQVLSQRQSAFENGQPSFQYDN